MHGFNVLVIKLVLLCGRHVSSGRPTGLIQNISNIKVKCLVEFLANLAKYCRNLDIITVTSTKIVDIAIRNAGIDQRIFDGRTAFLAFYHHEEPNLRHCRNQTPIVGVTGYKNERVHIVLIILSAGPGSQTNVNKRLVFFDAFDQDMLNWNLGEALQNLPRRCGMNIIIEDDFTNLIE